jgi:hypothetical protein
MVRKRRSAASMGLAAPRVPRRSQECRKGTASRRDRERKSARGRRIVFRHRRPEADVCAQIERQGDSEISYFGKTLAGQLIKVEPSRFAGVFLKVGVASSLCHGQIFICW